MGWQTLLLDESGMTCMNCVGHVTRALVAVRGVKRADVDLEAAQATVVAKDGVRREELVAAVREAGYEA